jgi:hypothetical protein
MAGFFDPQELQDFLAFAKVWNEQVKHYRVKKKPVDSLAVCRPFHKPVAVRMSRERMIQLAHEEEEERLNEEMGLAGD